MGLRCSNIELDILYDVSNTVFTIFWHVEIYNF